MTSSPSATQRQRGQRGVEVLDQMHADPATQLVIHESGKTTQEAPYHTRMIEVARLLDARLLTTDETLAKVARLQGVMVLNLQELTEALKPNIIVGEKIRLALVRPGKDEHQAVGYLTDGTMIVVNHAAELMGTTQNIYVISKLQTSNGLMVFAELDRSEHV
jgi:uncharacterized protein YacL